MTADDEPAAGTWNSWPGTWLPENEVPVPLGWHAVLGRSEDLAVGLLGAHLYSTAIALHVSVWSRKTAPAGLLPALSGGIFHNSSDLMLLGVQYPDGRRGTNLPLTSDPGEHTPRLIAGAGGGGGRHAETSYHLSPLPPPGPLVLVCAWPTYDIAETFTTVEAAGLDEAITRIQMLWPLEPEPLTPPIPAELPAVSDGGWFESTLTRALDGRGGPGGSDKDV